jgi:hypothetical protein
MYRPGIIGALACALLGHGEAAAQARGAVIQHEPRTPEMLLALHERKTADMTTWLPRLVGRFRIEGTLEDPASYCYRTLRGQVCITGRPQAVPGMADCIAVGSGPGVNCVLSARWYPPDVVRTMAPGVIQYGLDPNASLIRYLNVSDTGFAEEGAGQLRSNTLHYKRMRCVNRRVHPPCMLVTRITAPPDGAPIRISIDTEVQIPSIGYMRIAGLTLILHRLPQEESPRSSVTPAR